MATRFEIDHPKLERNFKYFRRRMAINAVQIWVLRAFADVPTNVLILRFCLIVLKKISICHRSLYAAAIVVAPKVRWFVRRTTVSPLSRSHASILLRGWGYFFFGASRSER